MGARFKLCAVLVTLATSGCDSVIASIAAGSTTRVVGRSAPALQQYADIDLAESALPGSISTMEGLLLVNTDSPTLHVSIARAWASYAFGFLEDHMEQALADDDVETAERYRARASTALLRAKEVGLEQMALWEWDDGGPGGHIRLGVDAWRRYLRGFDNPEQQGVLFWTAYSWARYIALHRDDVSALADVPYVVALAERVKEMDPSYNLYAPHALMAGLIGSAPAQIGGRPDLARIEFDVAIAATRRRNLMYLVLEARIVAVALQDRAMYGRLLREVLEASDVDPSVRLTNQLAKRRAVRYLAEIDALFEPEGAPAVDPTPTAAAR